METKSIQELDEVEEVWALILADESYGRMQGLPSVYLKLSFCLFFHQDDDLALKSPRIIVNKEFDEAGLRKSSSKCDRKFSNLALLFH